MTDQNGGVGEAALRAVGQHARPERIKRFYTDTDVAKTDTGQFAVRLDGRGMRSPGKRVIAVDREDVAAAIAQEWQAQGDFIDPLSMPMTRLVNVALDGVAESADAVRAEIADYAMTDLICYFADNPEGLLLRQTQQWDPFHRYFRDAFGHALRKASGIIAVDQDPLIRDAVIGRLQDKTALVLAAAATVTALSGSAIMTLALMDRFTDADTVWAAAHVDEDWQIELWGEDEEAMERRALRRTEFDAAALALVPNEA